MKSRFKKFGGAEIEDVGAYLREYLSKYPQTSVYVGTDSKQKPGGVLYATCICLYDEIRKDGVHFIFKREKEEGRIDLFTRMWREMEKSVEVADYLETELEGHLKRYTIEDLMVMKNYDGGYFKIHQSKLCVIDVDVNPEPGGGKNLSNVAYETIRGTLIGMGYRARFKGEGEAGAMAASSAADVLCNKNKRSNKGWKKKKLRRAA